MPVFSYLLFLIILANVSFPGSLNFWGEILAFKACLLNKYGLFLILIVLFSILLSAIYSFNIYNQIIFGVFHKLYFYSRDLNKKELFSLLVLILLTWLIGLFPNYITYKIKNFIFISIIYLF